MRPFKSAHSNQQALCSMIILFSLSLSFSFAQNVEINGSLEVTNLSISNSSNDFLIRKEDGKLGVRDLSSLPIGGVPTTGVIMSEKANNSILLNAGFREIGKQQIQYATRSIGAWANTSVNDVPSARELHTAVWTGSKMVIWGGRNLTNTFRNGGIYDPSTDIWLPFEGNAPVARSSHTAVWTGSEMIVWGGIDGSGEDPLESGRRFSPSSGMWTIISNTDAPSARYGHSAVWTGTEMLIWGGTDGSTSLGDGAMYNPNTDQWTEISDVNAPSARLGQSVVWTGTEMIVWGGIQTGVGFLNDGKRYNPNTDTWTTLSLLNAPTARSYHSAVWTGDRMVIWGGIDGGGSKNSGALYDPVSDSWTTTSLSNAPAARYSHHAVWTGTLMIVHGAGNSLGATGGYDPVSDRWLDINMNNHPSFRVNSSIVSNGNEIIIWGGVDSGGHTNSGAKGDLDALGDYGNYNSTEFYLYRKE